MFVSQQRFIELRILDKLLFLLYTSFYIDNVLRTYKQGSLNFFFKGTMHIHDYNNCRGYGEISQQSSPTNSANILYLA